MSEEYITEIREVTKYITSDWEEHNSREAAERHVEQIVKIAKANTLLGEGATVADCLRMMGYEVIDPILERVTLDTSLTIPHWQCRDTPGYRVIEFRINGRLWVYGDAGSWSGSYGNEVPVRDLIGYAKDKRTIGLKEVTHD